MCMCVTRAICSFFPLLPLWNCYLARHPYKYLVLVVIHLLNSHLIRLLLCFIILLLLFFAAFSFRRVFCPTFADFFFLQSHLLVLMPNLTWHLPLCSYLIWCLFVLLRGFSQTNIAARTDKNPFQTNVREWIQRIKLNKCRVNTYENIHFNQFFFARMKWWALFFYREPYRMVDKPHWENREKKKAWRERKTTGGLYSKKQKMQRAPKFRKGLGKWAKWILF